MTDQPPSAEPQETQGAEPSPRAPVRSEAAIALWELLDAEREAARRADPLALLALQDLKRDAIAAIDEVPDAEREELVRYARRNLRLIGTLLSCYEGLLDIPTKPQTYGASGRLQINGGQFKGGQLKGER